MAALVFLGGMNMNLKAVKTIRIDRMLDNIFRRRVAVNQANIRLVEYRILNIEC
jgi:hypothetical protein